MHDVAQDGAPADGLALTRQSYNRRSDYDFHVLWQQISLDQVVRHDGLTSRFAGLTSHLAVPPLFCSSALQSGERNALTGTAFTLWIILARSIGYREAFSEP